MLLTVRRAIETQLESLRTIELLTQQRVTPLNQDLMAGWHLDREMVVRALPVSWSAETTRTVLQAAQCEMPQDTLFNRWNLGSDIAWWYFEDPLPIPTNDLSASPGCPADFPDHLRRPPIRALCCGWCLEKQQFRTINRPDTRRVFRVAVWTDDPLKTVDKLNALCTTITIGAQVESGLNLTGRLIPSQTWCWMENESFQDMLTRLDVEHEKIYNRANVKMICEPYPKAGFLDASARISKFILAAMAWFDQKILIRHEEHVERHLRKEFNRKTARPIGPTLKVIHLRKREYPSSTTSPENSSDKRQYDYHWVVEGHWRQQACGPQWSDRRLTFVRPHLKGPADKPLKEHVGKAVVVDH